MTIKTVVRLSAIFLLNACASANDASSPPSPVIVGGYADTEVTQDVKAAALFAVQTQIKHESKPLELVKIAKAKLQVVAGINYQFELAVKSKDTLYYATAIVFKALDGTYKLTSWQWLSSEKAE
jgi:hypothetical protein